MALSSHTQPIVSIVARPDAHCAWIRLIGDIDIAAEPGLANATDRFNGLALRFVVIDLTAVTYVGSTLVNFLVALHRTHPGAELVVHHPSSMARIVITATGIDRIVTMGDWPGPPATSPGHGPRATAIALFDSHLPDTGSSAMRKPHGRWEALNRKPGHTRDGGESAGATNRTGARGTTRRLADSARFLVQHPRTLLRWMVRTGPSRS